MQSICEWIRPVIKAGIELGKKVGPKLAKAGSVAATTGSAAATGLYGYSALKDLNKSPEETAPQVVVNHNYPQQNALQTIGGSIVQHPGIAGAAGLAAAGGLGYLAYKKMKDNKKKEEQSKQQ
jgi:uncharacterized membrane protein YebE (DUF533 family)